MVIHLRDCGAKAKRLLHVTADTLFPARCPSCALPVGTHGTLCVECWGAIHFIADPVCVTCGLPFEHPMGFEAMCGHCMQQTPAFAQARSVFRYDENSRNQVLALKYHDKTQLAPVFGSWLAHAGKSYADKVQYILPVPMHYWRLVSRRYNQASLLAHALGPRVKLPVLSDVLKRTRATVAQSGLSRRQREDNVDGAFCVVEKERHRLKGTSVLLVDDVMTTGATLNACARTLHDAGVCDVYVLTLARTVIGA